MRGQEFQLPHERIYEYVEETLGINIPFLVYDPGSEVRFTGSISTNINIGEYRRAVVTVEIPVYSVRSLSMLTNAVISCIEHALRGEKLPDIDFEPVDVVSITLDKSDFKYDHSGYWVATFPDMRLDAVRIDTGFIDRLCDFVMSRSEQGSLIADDVEFIVDRDGDSRYVGIVYDDEEKNEVWCNGDRAIYNATALLCSSRADETCYEHRIRAEFENL